MNRGASMRVLVLAVASAVLVTLMPATPASPLPVGPAPVSAQSAACKDGWREISLPIPPHPHYLLAVTPNASGPKWLLGGSHREGAVIFRKNGGTWKQLKVPNGGTKGLTGGGYINSYTVALSGYNNSPQTGTTGKASGSKYVQGKAQPGTLTLTDMVRANGRIWAVGTRERGAYVRATALRKTGGSWKRLDPPTAATESALTAVDATPTGRVWAVGWWQRKGTWNRPYIVHRTSSGWKTSKPASIGLGEAVLTDIHMDSAKRGWITGYHVPKGTSRFTPILQRWNGTAWRNVELPFAAGRSLIARSVVTDDAGRLWMAGTQLPSGDREVRGWTAERTNGVWTFRVLDLPDGLSSELRSLASSASQAVVVGSVKGTMLALEACEAEVAGTRRKIGVGSIKARKRVPLGGDDDGVELIEEIPEYTIAGSKPPGFGTRVTPAAWYLEDVSSRYGLDTSTKTWSGLVYDFDGNGWDDIFYSRHLAVKPRLYLASGSGLTLAPGAGFSVVDRHGCDAADIDGNGQGDIYCATGKVRGTSTGRHELSMNVASSGAQVLTGSLGALDPLGRGRYVTFLDHDGDGDDDLFITSEKRRVDGLPRGNRFYENVGGKFVPAPGVGLDTSQGGHCLWSGDIDRDGDEDLISCVTKPVSGNTGVRLYRNERGRLVDRTANRGIRPIGDVDVEVADVTGDGRPDLIQLSKTRLRVSKQTGSGFVKIYEASTVDAVALAVGDVNKDDLADIYVLRGGQDRNRKDVLLVNRLQGTRFRSVKIPTTNRGDADDVLAIDHDRNGRTDFLVLNGASVAGPVQLLATFDR